MDWQEIIVLGPIWIVLATLVLTLGSIILSILLTLIGTIVAGAIVIAIGYGILLFIAAIFSP
jgi:hypothetical protein